MKNKTDQSQFNMTIGRLDRVLSLMVNWGKHHKLYLDDANKQTLKHHAEDMIAAGQKILKDLGVEVEGTPQSEKSNAAKCVESVREGLAALSKKAETVEEFSDRLGPHVERMAEAGYNAYHKRHDLTHHWRTETSIKKAAWKAAVRAILEWWERPVPGQN